MKTGIELIATERQEQIDKHGWDLSNHEDYGSGQLLKAAEFCLTDNDETWPWHDGGVGTYFFNKIKAKSKQDRIVLAGAFCAEELDRLTIIVLNKY